MTPRYRHVSGAEAEAPKGSKRDALMAADPANWEPLDMPTAKAEPKAQPKAQPTKGSSKS